MEGGGGICRGEVEESAKGGEREPGEVNRAARGLRNGGPSWAEVRARGWEPLFIAGRGC